MKFRKKIFCFFTILLTGCFAFFLIIVYRNVSTTNRSLTQSLSTQVIESKAQEASSWFEQRLSELRMIALQDAVTDGNIDSLRPYINRLNSNIGRNFGNEWGTFAIGRTDGKGWVSDAVTIDVSGRSYFQEAMSTDQEYVLSTPVISKTDAGPICLLCYPLRDSKQKTFGFLNAAISLNKLTQLVQEIEFYDSKSWIMDTSGIAYTAADTYPDPVLVDEILPRLQENPSLRSYENKEMEVFFTPISSAKNLILCTAVERSRLMHDTNQLIVLLLAAWAVVLAAALIGCRILASGITRPLSRLEQSMASVEQGNLNIRADIRGKDEITSLSQSFNRMLDRIEALMDEIALRESQRREGELKLLQSQINPHFLYNCLDTLQWKAYDHDDEEISQLIAALSSFFRISLSKGKETIPLTKELEHIRNYLFIQQMRFQDVLSYVIESDLETEHYFILKLTLQPLVENAIQHGIKPKLYPGTIRVRVWEEDDCLYFLVSDDGVGIAPEKLQKLQEALDQQLPGEGYGMYNVNQRLKLFYGSAYGLQITSEEGIGTCVTGRIPTVKKENDDV
ncbi:MAG: sensor histidine kinase [Lachnospiraceae bacterium]|nr:sensor histidine kinase [Lachnospiraceae bacterium]